MRFSNRTDELDRVVAPVRSAMLALALGTGLVIAGLTPAHAQDIDAGSAMTRSLMEHALSSLRNKNAATTKPDEIKPAEATQPPTEIKPGETLAIPRTPVTTQKLPAPGGKAIIKAPPKPPPAKAPTAVASARPATKPVSTTLPPRRSAPLPMVTSNAGKAIQLPVPPQ